MLFVVAFGLFACASEEAPDETGVEVPASFSSVNEEAYYTALLYCQDNDLADKVSSFVLDYDTESDYFSVDIGSEYSPQILDAVSSVYDGQDARLQLIRHTTSPGLAAGLTQSLAGLDFTSLTLRIAGTSRDGDNSIPYKELLTNSQNIVELSVDIDGGSYVDGTFTESDFSYDLFQYLPKLTKLHINDVSGVAGVIFHKLHTRKPWAIQNCENLKELSFSVVSTNFGKQYDQYEDISFEGRAVLEYARACPSIESIQGVAVNNFEPSEYLNEDEQDEFAIDFMWVENDRLVEAYRNGEITEVDPSDSLDGKLVIMGENIGTVGPAREGEDYEGIANEYLAQNYSEMRYLIYIYVTKGSEDGSYTDGSTGYEGITRIFLIDVEQNTGSMVKIATTSSPQSTAAGNADRAVLGDADKDAVFEYILSRL